MTEGISWYVYIVQCNDGSFYAGITNHLSRRVREHNEGTLGAKYTSSRRPVRLVYFENASSRSEAASREFQVKSLTRSAKKELVSGFKMPEMVI